MINLLWIGLLTAIFQIYLASFLSGVTQLELKNKKEHFQLTSNMTVSEELVESPIEGIITDYSSIKKENCHQALIEICLTLQKECNGTNAFDVWGWLIACADGNCDNLVSGSDYSIVSGTVSMPYVNLNILPVRTSGNCNNKILYGQFLYYQNIKRAGLNCDNLKADLNGLKQDSSSCAIIDIIKE